MEDEETRRGTGGGVGKEPKREQRTRERKTKRGRGDWMLPVLRV